MSADKVLRLQVVFGALDRLGAPLRQLQAGSKSLGRSLGETQRELAGLKKAQLQVGQYRGAEQRFQKSAAELATLRERTAAVRAEIEKVGAPTKRMAAALRAAETAEAKAIGRNEAHGAKLQELSRHLEAAGVDVARLGDHEEKLGRQMYEANKRLDAQREKLERVQRLRKRGEAVREVGGKVASVGAMATVGITAPAIALVASSIPAAIESQKATADVMASLTAMGPKAARSLEQLSQQASDLQDNSLFDDDDIMDKVTANMLTFGNISGKVFDRAQQAVVDITAKLGGDLQERTTMVAKALQDPVHGMAALGKTGTLTKDWIAANKQRIEAMVKSGQMAKAQGLILDELAHQYGGSAKAQRDADPTAGSQQAWRTFQEALGGAGLKVLPTLTRLLEKVTAVIDKLSPDQLLMVIIALAAIGPVLTIVSGAISVIGAIMSGVAAIAAFFGVTMLAAFGWIAVIIAAIAALGAAVYLIYNNWGAVSGFFGKLWSGITERFNQGLAFMRALIPSWGEIGKMMLQGLLAGLNPLVLVQHLLGLGAKAVAALKWVLGIKSPSRVFAAIGGHMMTGLDQGLDRGARGPLRRLGSIGDGMTAAMAGSALMATPAAAASAGPGPGSRAPTNHYHTYHITLQGGPGVDMRAQARELMAEMKRLQEEERRGSYEDTD